MFVIELIPISVSWLSAKLIFSILESLCIFWYKATAACAPRRILERFKIFEFLIAFRFWSSSWNNLAPSWLMCSPISDALPVKISIFHSLPLKTYPTFYYSCACCCIGVKLASSLKSRIIFWPRSFYFSFILCFLPVAPPAPALSYFFLSLSYCCSYTSCTLIRWVLFWIFAARPAFLFFMTFESIWNYFRI